MAEYVTLEEAKRHLKLDPPAGSPASDQDADVQDKLDAAEAIVLEYLADADPFPISGITAGALAIVRAGILLQLGDLWSDRGDDPARDSDREHGWLAKPVVNVLHRLRLPKMS